MEEEKRLRTGVIKYNLNERVRKLTGQNRAFDVKKVARQINSKEFQESVKHGDVFGYYGHSTRKMFGLRPDEIAFKDGSAIVLEPAISTVSIKASDNGDIEHVVEFLGTATGMVAQKLHVSNRGGFSSIIDPSTGIFYGFDFVLSPNYSGNRGYAMAFDSIGDINDEYREILGEFSVGLFTAMDCLRDVEKEKESAVLDSIEKSKSIIELARLRVDEKIKFDEAIAKISELELKNKTLASALDSATAVKLRGDDAKRQRSENTKIFFDAINSGQTPYDFDVKRPTTKAEEVGLFDRKTVR